MKQPTGEHLFSQSFRLTLGGSLLLCAFSAHAAEPILETVNVIAPRESGLGLSTPSTGGSRTGVTARELPASFETVDSETMKERGDTRVLDAVTRTTGLVNTGTPGVGGLGMSSRGFAGTGSVGIAEDGVRIQTAASTQNYPSTAWGYERAEVLRGPASIVYGTGTVGATINMVRKQPTRESRQEVMVGAGTDGYKQLGFGASGALGEIVSYRVDAYGFHNDGYRELGNSQGGKLMSRFRIQPRSNFHIDLTADISNEKPERYLGTPHDNGHIVKSLRDKNYNTSDSLIRYQDTRLRAKAEWQVNDRLALTNEVYYLETERTWKNIEAYQFNPGGGGTVNRGDFLYIRHNLEQTGNRAEALFKAANHRLVAGWETQYIRFKHTNNSPYNGDPSITPFVVSASNPTHGIWSTLDSIRTTMSTTSTFNAFYVEDAWKFHERWQLMAGVRRDMSEVSRTNLSGIDSYRNQKLNGTAWRLGLTHFLTRDTSLYANFSQGHDPITGLITANLTQSKYRLTKGKQIEAGIKQSFGKGRGEWTAAVFQIDKKDILTRDPMNNTLTIQGGKQSSEGLELAAAIRPTQNWRFEGNYTYVKARFDELLEGNPGISRKGNTPTNVPTHVANLWGHYTLGAWQASLGTRYVGKRYANNANSITMPSYLVADASLAYRYDKNTTFRFFARNLTDKVYATAPVNTQFILGEPRRFDLVAEFKF